MGETALFFSKGINPPTFRKTQSDSGRHIWEERLFVFLPRRQVGRVLDDGVAGAQVAKVLEQPVRSAERARARKVLQREKKYILRYGGKGCATCGRNGCLGGEIKYLQRKQLGGNLGGGGGGLGGGVRAGCG